MHLSLSVSLPLLRLPKGAASRGGARSPDVSTRAEARSMSMATRSNSAGSRAACKGAVDDPRAFALLTKVRL